MIKERCHRWLAASRNYYKPQLITNRLLQAAINSKLIATPLQVVMIKWPTPGCKPLRHRAKNSHRLGKNGEWS
jgi:hypothetical protein